MVSSKPGVTRGAGLLERWLARERAKVADGLIPANARGGCIVDIGCGLVPYFLLHTVFCQKIGVDKIVRDVPAPMLSGQDLILISHDIERTEHLPLKSNLCDVVVLLAVIEHIESERVVPLLHETWRILKDRGTLILTTPASWTDRLLRIMAKLGLVSPVEIAEHKNVYNRKRLLEVMGQVFDSSEIRAGYFEFFANMWVVARK